MEQMLELVKDASSKTIGSPDAHTVVLRPTPSNDDTQRRASKDIQNIGQSLRTSHLSLPMTFPDPTSNNMKESGKVVVHATETRLPLTSLRITSDNVPEASRSDLGNLLLRRIETTKLSSNPGHSAVVAVPTSANTVSHPTLLNEIKEPTTTPQLVPVTLPTNDQPRVATGSPPLYWPVTTSAQAEAEHPEYVSSFLHGFTERVDVIPTHLGLSLSEHSVHAWMYWVLATVSDPRSEQAKGLLRGNPGGVLFAAQLQLATAWSREIEEMAQRATSRDYYYDLLMRACGHARAKEWVTGRGGGEEGGRRRRTGKGSGGLSLRKRVLVGQGFKVYNEMVRRQLGEGSVSTEV